MTRQTTVPSLELVGASKEFFGVSVLRNVDLTIQAGEIHALLGQNGSGKSTLIKILAGIHVPESGTSLRVQGIDVDFPLSADPSKHGMAFVHQNLGLAPDMSVLDNLSVGDYQRKGPFTIDWKAQRSLALKQLSEFGITCDLDAAVSSLTAPSQKALLAVARAVTSIRQTHAKGILVLDEPTVYLPQKEVEYLQQVVRNLAKTGVGVLYVTHRLEELRDFADRASILRDGEKVAEVDVAQCDTGALVELITGSRIEVGRTASSIRSTGQTTMSIRDLTAPRVNAVSFDLYEGEILGLTGLAGMGQDEVLSAIFGAVSPTDGSVLLDCEPVVLNPRAAIRHGVAYLPAERPVLSGAMLESVAENITLPVLKEFFFRRGRIDRREESRHVTSLMELLDVKPRDGSLLLERFSGGNQQKALLGKWLQTKPRVLLLDEPVQGVDIGAKAQIFEQLRSLAKSGSSVVVASSEYEDLAALCDRVLIFEHGRITTSLEGSEVSKQRIAAACFGAGASIATGPGDGP